MARHILIILVGALFLSACAGTGYNTQKGAVIGGGLGALAGQAIGRNTESTLIGAAAGTLLGAITGNAVDQHEAYQRFPHQTAHAYPPAPAYAAPEDEVPPGEWIVVPGRWVRGRWVPAHRVWVPVNP